MEVLEEIPKGLGVREPLDRLRSSAGAAERVEEKLYVSAREIVGMQKKVDNVP